MISQVNIHSFILIFILLIGNTMTAHAHSLPGSTLTLSQQGEQLNISVSFALEDLVLAAPIFESLTDKGDNHKLEANSLERLSAYLEKHLFLKKENKRIIFEAKQAAIQMTYDKNVGEYLLILVKLTAQSVEGDIFPLQLTYDGIMHEIRSHRAVVNYIDQGKSVFLTHFGFHKVNGKQKSQTLALPYNHF